MNLRWTTFLQVALVFVLVSSCRSAKNHDGNDSVITGTKLKFGGREPQGIPWERVEIYEYQKHAKAQNGLLKKNPDLKVMKAGQRLKPIYGQEKLLYLWVAAQPKGRALYDLEYRWGPEYPMPGAPMGGTEEKPKKPKFGHPTLAGWDAVVSGGEIRFHGDHIEINNDSGRINRFYPDSKIERGAFCDSVKEISRITGEKFKAVWIDFVGAKLAKVDSFEEHSPFRIENACPQ